MRYGIPHSYADASLVTGVAAYCVKSDTPLSELAKIVDEHLGRLVVR